MNIVITGGAGFLGQRLAKTLLAERPDAQLTLVDVIKPTAPNGDARARCIEMDLRDPAHLGDIITPETDAVFHLAAIVSSHAEAEPDLGYEINFLATRNLLEAIRHTKPGIRFIFSSSLAVFGGKLPEVIQDSTAVTPQSTYGTQKGMCELLINDYSRKGFADGIALRLPTVCIRPGKPNKAASSFVSGIMREPLQGEDAVLPVSPALRLWLSSPDTVVANFIHAQQMLDDLAAIAGKDILARVKPQFDEGINAIVASWPAAIDNSTALKAGFRVDSDFQSVIRQFIEKDLRK